VTGASPCRRGLHPYRCGRYAAAHTPRASPDILCKTGDISIKDISYPEPPRDMALMALARPWWRRTVAILSVGLASVGLYLGYVRMSRTQSVNSDAAGNALQAWDMLHGNPLLRGWTVSDVPFYTNELVLYALLELIYGLNADIVHVGAAIIYTLLVVLAAAVAKGRASGPEAVARVGVAVAIMLVPTHGIGFNIVLNSPDHTGSGIPLLLTWLVLDRALTRRNGSVRGEAGRWLPYGIAGLLAWGQIADPLVLYVGALPLVVVSALRLWRGGRRLPRQWRGIDARLLAAGFGSVILAQGFLLGVRLAGGFVAHVPPVQFSPLSELGRHVGITVKSMGVLFGAYFPGLHGPAAVALGVLHLVGMMLVLGVVCLLAIRAVRPRSDGADGRVNEIMAAGILVNLGAFVVSTIPADLMSARQIVAVLPLGAALAGRVCGRWLVARRLMPILVAVLLVFGGEFVIRTMQPPVPAANQQAADWLVARHLSYGLGGYWSANDITLLAGGRVQVAPLIGGERLRAYRWESRADWFDPGLHDARFVVIDHTNPTYGTVATASAQFGAPIERHDVGRVTVLIYDHNLLVGLPAYCLPHTAPSMAECIKE
jgi:hypothetical protein